MFEFWRFKSISPDQYTLLTANFNVPLVILSVFVASLAAYASLVVLERAWASNRQKSKQSWLLFGSLVMGSGVWAMHFTGMLAYMMPVSMTFSFPITVFSALPAILGAFFMLNKLAKLHFGFLQIQVSALSLALGVGCMHFIGMEAIQTSALMTYDLGLFLLSILCAHLLATLALYLIMVSHRTVNNKLIVNIMCAIVMGVAVASMHYVAMASVSFYSSSAVTAGMQHDSLGLSFAIAGIISIFVATTVLCSIVDQRFEETALLALQSAIREKDIVEHMANALLVIKLSGGVVLANSAALKIFGYSAKEKENWQLEQLIPDLNYKKLCDDSMLLAPKILDCIITIEGIRASGEVFPIEARFSAMPVTANSQIMFNCVVSDISSKVQLEEQLHQAHKLESIGQLAAGIAHEINTPAQYVADNTSFLQDAFGSCIAVLKVSQALSNKTVEQLSEDDLLKLRELISEADLDFIIDEVPAAFEQSLEGLHRISSIVKAMKSFSHPSKGEVEPVNLSDIIEMTITVARNEWRYVADLYTKFDGSLPKVNCTRDELSQVLLNVIVNAAHAIEESLVNKEGEQGLIEIITSREGDYAIIKISDNGTGMSADVQKRIFDPFFTTKEVGKGTGQGLNLAYSVIVEQHKGKISAQSELGKGTSIIISLPIINANFEQDKPKRQERADESIIC